MLRNYSLKHGMQRTIPALILVFITFAFIAAACGTATDGGGSSAGSAAPGNGGAQAPTVNPQPTGVLSQGTAQGCPSGAVVTTPTKPTITVSESNKDTTIVAHQGDTIEFRFPFGKKWSGPQSSLDGLALQGPAGYASQANNACVWDFSARNVGTTQLTFNSQALCKRGELCPQYIIAFSFTVQVK